MCVNKAIIILIETGRNVFTDFTYLTITDLHNKRDNNE